MKDAQKQGLESNSLAVQEFLEEFETAFFNLLHGWCNNRARFRRRLRRLIPMLATIESKAELLEASFFTKSNSTGNEDFLITHFVISVLLEAMKTYLLLGFELELYHTSEYKEVFWYLDYLTHVQVQNMRKLEAKTTHPALPTGVKLQKKYLEKVAPTTTFSDESLMKISIFEIENCLARGLFRFLTALGRVGEYKMDSEDFGFTFGSNKARYETRFEVFLYVSQPSYVPFEDYCKISSMPDSTPLDLFKSAEEHFVVANNIANTTLSRYTTQVKDEMK